MSRGIGEFGPIQDAVPEWAALVVAALTQLGDVWFLTLVFVALFWFEAADREGLAVLTGLTLAGIGTLRGLKHVFGLPRPDRPLVEVEALPLFAQSIYEVTGTASGYGFPSGHATTATIVYVGLAGVLTVGTRRQRYGVAATLVAVVSASRVALGVHYVVDVVAGVALGLAFLVAAFALVDRYPSRRVPVAFALAVASGVFYLVASGVTWEVLAQLVAAVGGLVGWGLVVDR